MKSPAEKALHHVIIAAIVLFMPSVWSRAVRRPVMG
jgi:hypothetical protein